MPPPPGTVVSSLDHRHGTRASRAKTSEERDTVREIVGPADALGVKSSVWSPTDRRPGDAARWTRSVPRPAAPSAQRESGSPPEEREARALLGEAKALEEVAHVLAQAVAAGGRPEDRLDEDRAGPPPRRPPAAPPLRGGSSSKPAASARALEGRGERAAPFARFAERAQRLEAAPDALHDRAGVGEVDADVAR